MAASRPGAGATVVASSVTTTGPTMNTASSMSDSTARAVGSEGASGSSAVHRARAKAPICGSDPPAATASATSSGPGPLASVAATRAPRAATWTASCGTSTRAWPRWSASRLIGGAMTLWDMAIAPATSPASVYERPRPLSISTEPSPIIPCGRRASAPAPQNAAAPGTASRRT